MSSGTAYITASCIIRDHCISRNGEVVLEADKGLDLQEMLRAGYDRFSGQYPKFHKMDTLSKLGWLAAEVLLQDSGIHQLPPEAAGLVLSNRSASLDTDLRYYATVKDIASPALFVYTLPNIVMGEICIRHGFKGENTFFVSDEFDAALLGSYPAQLLAETPLQACLCGWVEVMGQQYDTALFLVENKASGLSIPLSPKALGDLYQTGK
ncbi:MAG TPA: beta-ketoacyl synthase N-terminal-like domain-containing protein [Chitinophaga sp.]|uniref:beta-ketoacyl synthase N-terminal-like domain-containing protein n=1 Tax=Chitinophaga sp. TaxID=1869181 RepID=UPI002C45A369|nr:beta-ketoacyl synthase N-terminal-like domain-containing protein [Chitinophaga sp.]HVI47598.1 beta-ketoacyl synthase N-terminal-like domain-containing protein [Chitinophaga sp.]